jgi:hypothetical protein
MSEEFIKLTIWWSTNSCVAQHHKPGDHITIKTPNLALLSLVFLLMNHHGNFRSNSMELSPSQEAITHPPSQGIPCLL